MNHLNINQEEIVLESYIFQCFLVCFEDRKQRLFDSFPLFSFLSIETSFACSPNSLKNRAATTEFSPPAFRIVSTIKLPNPCVPPVPKLVALSSWDRFTEFQNPPSFSGKCTTGNVWKRTSRKKGKGTSIFRE